MLNISPGLGIGVCLLNPGPTGTSGGRGGGRGKELRGSGGACLVMKNVQAVLSNLLTNESSMTSGHCGIRQSYGELQECSSTQRTLTEDLLSDSYQAYKYE